MIRLNRRLISATVSGISPGSEGGGWSGRVGIGAADRWRVAAAAAVTAQTARAAMASTVWRSSAVVGQFPGLVVAADEQEVP